MANKEEKIIKFQKNIEASFDALERMNFDIKKYLNYLQDKYDNIDEKETENTDNKISLLSVVNNKYMCNIGHEMTAPYDDAKSKCNQCGAKGEHLCWSCYYYDRKYNNDNWDKSYNKYICCKDCSLLNGENVKKTMEKRKKKQQEIIEYYNKNPEISVDLLCGLPSKLSLEYLLKEIVVNKDANDYTLYLFDIDNFKKVNKDYGHNFKKVKVNKDKKLKEIGQILKQYADKPGKYWYDKGVMVDKVWSFRQGGDEFTIITKGKTEKISTQKEFIGEIKEKINRIGINISIGVLCYGGFIEDSDKWLDLCDSALYSAKTVKGKNSLKIYDGVAKKNQIIDSFENIKCG